MDVKFSTLQRKPVVPYANIIFRIYYTCLWRTTLQKYCLSIYGNMHGIHDDQLTIHSSVRHVIFGVI